MKSMGCIQSVIVQLLQLGKPARMGQNKCTLVWSENCCHVLKCRLMFACGAGTERSFSHLYLLRRGHLTCAPAVCACEAQFTNIGNIQGA